MAEEDTVGSMPGRPEEREGGRQHLGARGVDPAARFAPLNSGKSSQAPLALLFLSRPDGRFSHGTVSVPSSF